ncbi:MAG: YceI family protein [Candidatus Sulfobium sp.]|jgi:hypothetical protein
MQRFDESSAVCQIFTYKEGLLSPFAHDLRIGVASFTVEVGGSEHFIKASFNARSLQVDCAMVDGKERPDLLSQGDREEINRSIEREVLHSDSYPLITLISSSVRKDDSRYLVNGTLTLHEKPREITFTVRKEDGTHYVSDVRLHLPDFGIKPFSTLFGTVKIKPDILIHIRIPTGRIEEASLS